ncbi:FAD/NAD(P)-binding domain-containing protein [Trametes coccinea BRFM310]|uniref:FAD/NAD(P)-binding domain-containing protein n=1 Tax=Trametes coccinea (strain BRFM310) TaxID=1353009 RepID=A0A1Y2IAB9_TRAC3|nr:FAD/NAD(P)-binding domain-containing protein [Trametes coccinea BRFM310]
MTYPHSSKAKSVVILGGGVAGALTALKLCTRIDPAKHTLTLINNRPCFVHLTATARMVVTPEGQLENRAIIPLDRLLERGTGELKIGRAVAIKETAPGEGGVVLLDTDEAIPYDILVLATGSSWPRLLDFPDKPEDVRKHVDTWRHKFEAASHVVIVGGGAVGIELAGELKCHSPGKRVTIIHSEPLLLNSAYPDRFRKDIARRLHAKGIEVLLGDRVEIPPELTTGIVTRNGVQLSDADLVVQAYGAKPNTGFLRTWDIEILTSRGFVKVDAHLEVPGHPGVFAAGDIIDWPEEKQSHKAVEHVPVVVANVLRRLAGDAPRKVYRGSPETLVIPVGKTGGAGYVAVFGGFRVFVGDCVVRKVKAQTLSVDRARRELGYRD